MQGQLFTQAFLETGIKQTNAWQSINPQYYQIFCDTLQKIYANFSADSTVNEATTESEIIWKVLDALDWCDTLPQQTASAKGRYDVPDGLLFPDASAKAAALAEKKDELRYRHGIAIIESKRWQRLLDRGDKTDPLDSGTPSTQMLRYLSRVEVISERRIQWGILTNGRLWRLYWQGARSRSEDFLEIDLALAVGMPRLKPAPFSAEASIPEHFLKVFYLLFRRSAFLPQPADSCSFHQLALDEGRHWQALVSQDLGDMVFTQVFPNLVKALVQYDNQVLQSLTVAYLETVRRAALTLLYRLLFIFYAEDRNLLPLHDIRYAHYALVKIRHEIAQFIDNGEGFSATARIYHVKLGALCQAIAQGDTTIGLPPYNGGLFEAHPLLERAQLPDKVLATLIDNLSRRTEKGQRQWINYRDLSVQQLGSIYERLLEFAVVTNKAGDLIIQPNSYARKGSGSYYTHDELVKLVITQTLEPLINERVAAFQHEAETVASEPGAKSQRLQRLEAVDTASRLLDLKICDPAMGSGHFLVSLVDYLADQILEQMANASAVVTWTHYHSPLIERIEEIRKQILASAQAQHFPIDRNQLDERQIVRRMILKRVIYGVDKNPMAVELAKVALWLHTFTVGAPLSFLDHHLRCGDSLFGEWVGVVVKELQELGAIFMQNALAGLSAATQMMNDISELTDADIAEVTQSKYLFDSVDNTLKPLSSLLDFWQALRWISPFNGNSRRKQTVHPGLAPLLSGRFGDVMTVVSSEQIVSDNPNDKKDIEAINDLLLQTRAIVERERFLHWEVAFPTAWRHIERSKSVGGFDAVISNPPWDRIKLQEVEWFAARQPDIAQATGAAERKKRIAALQKNGDLLWDAYMNAKASAETAAKVARICGEYPQLSGGDVNLYALFVERAQRLVTSHGMIGLVTPSGIASDKGSSAFFQSLATTGRLKALFDFENQKVFFPDVDSRFKFCTFVFGGQQRQFSETKCAFFLHAVNELNDPERMFTLTAKHFAAVNPNTGTAPIFRHKRDADITTCIYSQFPVLVDRRTEPPYPVWPVRYTTMFHMTNDSHLFKRQQELEADGFYPVGKHIWRRGSEEFVPLYEGKMVQAYDHRAASITVNVENIHRPAQPLPASLKQHQDSTWLPTAQFWVDAQTVRRLHKIQWVLVFKEITAPTNMRTMIACLAPAVAFSNKVPLLQLAQNTEEGLKNYRWQAPLLLANLNAFAFDFIVRQKVHGQTLNLFILEQLPLIPPAAYENQIGVQKIADFIREQVLHLSYTAVDMQPFAQDMGYDGEPFPWDAEDRRHRLARFDALFFHLYQLDKQDASYILEQFPIVRTQDEKTFGCYLTKDLILAYMNAIAAGDLTSIIQF
ncbi:MAG TPA: restriction endonuclease [Thioploca sp.]|nr:restriction endonuclease [Thioploca sp.]